MKYFVINLPNYKDKKDLMISQLDNLKITNYEIVNGIDGSLIDDILIAFICDKTQVLKNIKRPLAKTEIGCALSHIKIYKKIIEENLDQAIILEDDVILNSLGHLSSINITQEFDIILLGSTSPFHIDKTTPHTLYKKDDKTSIHGGFGYLVSNQGCKKLLEHFNKINYPIDSWLPIGRADIKIGFISPPIISVNSKLRSHITPERSELINKFRK
jgi:glycosyl transferase, family 25